MKIANYNETTGKLLGWYDSEIHSTIPTPNIEVSETDWQVALDNGYNYVDATKKTLSKKDFRTADEILQQEKEAKIAEAKAYLLFTDYKVLPDYDGDTTGILEARADARALIRGGQ